MQSNSAIGSFLDEVTKWQKRLQLVEAVLESWVSVQEKWVQLDEIYSGADVRTALAHEANMFAVMSKDFRLLMRATEKNTNVLQSCSRKGTPYFFQYSKMFNFIIFLNFHIDLHSNCTICIGHILYILGHIIINYIFILRSATNARKNG